MMLIYTPDSSSESSSSSKRALFLDRDGVINTEINYLYKIEDFEFVDGIFDLCRAAVEHDYRIIVVTNQSGIARGYYGEADLEKLTKWMMREFAGYGIEISKVYACPHLIDADLEPYRCDCPARKPNPGMLLQAKEDFNLDLSKCIFIGDKASDMEAGLRAGIGSLILFDGSGSTPENLDEKIKHVSSLNQAKEKLFK
jgi:D-glycero-D-manno-heptose 1,7-bisphosphate phosphatase